MVSNIVLSVAAWASSLRSTFAESLKQEDGQDLVEYAVLVGAIAIVAGGVLFAMGPSWDIFVTKVTGCLTFTAADCQP